MGDTSGKTSSSQAGLDSTSTQNVWDVQSDYLQQLFSQGQVLSQDPAYARTAEQLSGQVTDPLSESFGQAFGGASGFNQAAGALTDPLIQGLTDIMNTPGPTFAEGGNNPLLDVNVASALEQASRNLNQNLLPGIQQDAIGAGQYGGSKGEIAEGLAVSESNRDALAAAMGLYGEQYAADRAANLQSQALRDQTRLGAGQQIQDILASQQAGVGAGVSAGGGLFDLGMLGQDATWDQLAQYAQLLGSPTVLGQTQTTGRSGTNPLVSSPSQFLPGAF
jgi:hypothetical protein